MVLDKKIFKILQVFSLNAFPCSLNHCENKAKKKGKENIALRKTKTERNLIKQE